MKRILVICLLLLFGSNVSGQSTRITPEEIERRHKEEEERMRKAYDSFDNIIFQYYNIKPNWVFLGETNTHFMFYNPKSIIRNTKNIKVWTRLVIKSAEQARIRKDESEKLKEAEYINTLFECDCFSRRIHGLSEITYNHNGDILDSQDFTTDWFYAPPDSFSYKIIDKVCSKKKKTSN